MSADVLVGILKEAFPQYKYYTYYYTYYSAYSTGYFIRVYDNSIVFSSKILHPYKKEECLAFIEEFSNWANVDQTDLGKALR